MSDLYLTPYERNRLPETQTPKQTIKPFSEWTGEKDLSGDAPYNYLRYADYVRDTMGDSYDTQAEVEIQKGLREGLSTISGMDEETLEKTLTPEEPTFNQNVKMVYSALPEGPERQTLRDYIAGATTVSEQPDATDEYKADVEIMRTKAEAIVGNRIDEAKQVLVNEGDLSFAFVKDDQSEDGKRLIVGDSAISTPLVRAIRSSRMGGVSFMDVPALQYQTTAHPYSNIPIFKHKQLMEISKGIEALAKSDSMVNEHLLGHARQRGRRNQSTAEAVAGTIGRGMSGLLNRLGIEGEEEGARRKRVFHASHRNHDSIIEHITEQLNESGANYSVHDVRDAYENNVVQTGFQKGVFKLRQEEEDELHQNVQITRLGPVVNPKAYLQNDVFEGVLKHPDLNESQKAVIKESRDIALTQNFQDYNRTLSNSDYKDEWSEELLAGRLAGKKDSQILTDFLTDNDAYSDVFSRGESVAIGVVDSIASLYYLAVSKLGDEEFGHRGLVGIAEDQAERRKLAEMFGADWGVEQDIMEGAAPLVVDVAATTLLGLATGGAAGAAYLTARTGARLTLNGLIKGITSNALRATGTEALERVAKTAVSRGLIKEAVETGGRKATIKALEAYNNTIAKKLGIQSALYTTASNRITSGAYGNMYSQLREAYPDMSDQEVRDKAMGYATSMGTVGGLITSAFSLMGRDGVETALLKGMNFRQAKELIKSFGNVAGITDKSLAGAMKEVMEVTLKKHGKSLLKGARRGLKHGGDEAMEEGISELVNTYIEDVALEQETPLMERFQQVAGAAFVGGVFGMGVPAARAVAGKLGVTPMDRVMQQVQLENQFYEDVAQKLKATGSSLSAKEIRNKVKERARTRPVEAPTEAQPPALPTPEEGKKDFVEVDNRPPDGVKEDQLSSTINTNELEQGPAAVEALLKAVRMIDPEEATIRFDGIQQRDRGKFSAQFEETTTMDMSDLSITPSEDSTTPFDVDLNLTEFGRRLRNVTEGPDTNTVVGHQTQRVVGHNAERRSSIPSNSKARAKRNASGFIEFDNEVGSTVQRKIFELASAGYPATVTRSISYGIPLPKGVSEVALTEHAASYVYALYPTVKTKKPVAGSIFRGTSSRTRFNPRTGRTETGQVTGFLDERGIGQFDNDPIVTVEMLRAGIPVAVPNTVKNINPSIIVENGYVKDVVGPTPDGGALESKVDSVEKFATLYFDNSVAAMMRTSVDSFKAVDLPKGVSKFDESNGAILEGSFSSTTEIVKAINKFGLELDREGDGRNELAQSRFEASSGPLSVEGVAAAKDRADQQFLFNAYAFELRDALQNDPKGKVGKLLSRMNVKEATAAQRLLPFIKVEDVKELSNKQILETFIDQKVINNPDFSANSAPTYASVISKAAEEIKSQEDYIIQRRESEAKASLPDSDLDTSSGRLNDFISNFGRKPDGSIADPASVAAMVSGAVDSAIDAINTDQKLRIAVDSIVSNGAFDGSPEVNEMVSSLKPSDLFGIFSSWAVSGNGRVRKSVKDFISSLESEEFSMGMSLRNALVAARFTTRPRGMALFNPPAVAEFQSLFSDITNVELTSDEARNTMIAIDGALRTRLSSANLTATQRQQIAFENEETIADLGLESGNADSVVTALEKVAKTDKNPNHKLVANLLLEDPSFIKSVKFVMGEGDADIAGKYVKTIDGNHTVFINRSTGNGRGLVNTLLEEYVHASVSDTVSRIDDLPRGNKKTAALKLKALFNKTDAAYRRSIADGVPPNPVIESGLANLDEFVAHFLLSGDFQKFIKTVQDPQTKFFNSIIESMVSVFRRVSGRELDQYTSAFKDILDLGRHTRKTTTTNAKALGASTANGALFSAPTESIPTYLTPDQLQNLNNVRSGKSQNAPTPIHSEFSPVAQAADNLANGFSLSNGTSVTLERGENGSVLFEGGDRAFVVVNVNGSRVAFYQSTGDGGKILQSGKWYPTTGLEKGGAWINKTNSEGMATYYGSPTFAEIASKLDNTLGNVKRFVLRTDDGSVIRDIRSQQGTVVGILPSPEIRARLNPDGRETFSSDDGRVFQAMKDLAAEFDSAAGSLFDGVSLQEQTQPTTEAGVLDTEGLPEGMFDNVDNSNRADLQSVAEFIRSLVPPSIAIEERMNEDGSLAGVSPDESAIFIDPVVLAEEIRGLSILAAKGVVGVKINEELAHTASFNALTQAEVDAYVDALSDADFDVIIREYTSNTPDPAFAQKFVAALASEDPQVVLNAKRALAEEKLRMYLQKATRGFTTEEDYRFWKSEPSLLALLKRYFSGAIRRFAFNRKQIGGAGGAALNKMIVEMRAIEVGFVRQPNFQAFDANNPEASFSSFVSMSNQDYARDAVNAAPTGEQTELDVTNIGADVKEAKAKAKEAAGRLKIGEITREEYNAIVDELLPLAEFDEVPVPATLEDIQRGLGNRPVSSQDPRLKKELIVEPESIPEGERIQSRLDIPSYDQQNVWVVSIHKDTGTQRTGPIQGYSSTVVLRNVGFNINSEKAALNIATGKSKSTIATMVGDSVSMTSEAAYDYAQEAKASGEWVEVGMNPQRHSYFYVKETQEPVEAASEVIQVGGMVLAKVEGLKVAKKTDYLFSAPTGSIAHVYEKEQGKLDEMRKAGRVRVAQDIRQFSGFNVLFHQPDTAFAGEVTFDGETLVTGQGGVYYPLMFSNKNYFWASTRSAAVGMAKTLNEIGKRNGDKIYMALTSADVNKLFSSTTMSTATMDFFGKLSEKEGFYGLTKAQLNKILIEASEVSVPVDSGNPKTFKDVQLKEGSKYLGENIATMREALEPDNSVFPVRKAFVEAVASGVAKAVKKPTGDEILEVKRTINRLSKEIQKLVEAGEDSSTLEGELKSALNSQRKQRKVTKQAMNISELLIKDNEYAKRDILSGKLAKASIMQGLGNMFTEPFLKTFQKLEGKDAAGNVYAILELDGEVKALETPKEDSHQSYPYTIVSTSNAEPKIHVLDKSYKWSDITRDIDSKRSIRDAAAEYDIKIAEEKAVFAKSDAVVKAKAAGKKAPTFSSPSGLQDPRKVYFPTSGVSKNNLELVEPDEEAEKKSMPLMFSAPTGKTPLRTNIDASTYVDLLETTVFEVDNDKKPNNMFTKWVSKNLFGEVSEPVRRFIQYRSFFEKAVGDNVVKFKRELDKLIEETYGGFENAPLELIAQAQGYREGGYVGDEQLTKLDELYEKALDDISERRKSGDITADEAKAEMGAAQKAHEDGIATAEDAGIKQAEEDRNKALAEIATVSPKLAAFIGEIRQKHIIPIQKKLLDGGLDDDVRLKIDRTGQVYLTRSYKMFTDSTYFEMVKEDESYADIRAAAIDLFEKQFIKDTARKLMESDDKPLTYQEALAIADKKMKKLSPNPNTGYGQVMLDEFLSNYDPSAGGSSSSTTAGMKMLMDNFTRRKDLPKPIRDLLGEHGMDDGTDLILRTYSTVSSIAAQQTFLENLRNFGTDPKVGLMVDAQTMLATEENRKKYEGFVPVRNTKAGRNNDPMADIYVHRDFQKALDMTLKNSYTSEFADTAERTVNGALSIASKLSGGSMAFKTVLSISHHVRNGAGNLFFATAQGYLRYDKLFVSMGSAGMKSLFGKDQEIDPAVTELIGLGVKGDEIRSNIMRDLFTGKQTPEGIHRQLEELMDKAQVTKTKKGFDLIMKKAQDLSAALDAGFKVVMYQHELSVLKRAAEADDPDGKFGRMQESELKRTAARKILMTAQSYSQAPPLVSEITKSPIGLLFSPFLRFKAETFRIPFNTYKLGLEEIRSGNPVLKTRGIQRIAGMTSVLGVLSAAVPLLLSALSGVGDDEHEDEAMRSGIPEYLRGNTFFMFMLGGKQKSIDFTYVNPFAGIVDPILRSIEQIRQGNFSEAGAAFALGYLKDQFLDTQILAGAVINAAKNTDHSTGKPIWNKGADDPIDVASKLFGYVFSESYTPRIWKDAVKMYDAGSPKGAAYAFVEAFYPFRIHDVDFENQFQRYLLDHKKRYANVKSELGELRKNEVMDDADIREIIDKNIEKRRKMNYELMRITKGYSSLGVGNDKLISIMNDMKIGQNRIKLLSHNYMDRPSIKYILESLLSKEDPEMGINRADKVYDYMSTINRYLPVQPITENK